nr:MAG TPA: hypothetical protein [Caudoviricetes sp.]
MENLSLSNNTSYYFLFSYFLSHFQVHHTTQKIMT